MTALIASFALGIAFVAGLRVAAASTELDFPDADENGPDHFTPASAEPRLVAAPVVVRHIPMAQPAAQAKPAAVVAPPAKAAADVEFSDADEDGQ
jgi:hypothetical protein